MIMVDRDPFYVELSKREWFAGLAMQGFLSAEKQHGISNAQGLVYDRAEAAVLQADALLAELSKNPA